MNKPDLSKMRVEIKWAEDMWQQIKDATMTTVGKDKGGYPNHDWKLRLLMAEHSPIRLGFVILKIYDAPQFVHGHLVRHSNGVVPFVSSLRSDRNTLQSATYYFNFQALINVARKRLCNCASYETRKAFEIIKNAIIEFEPEAASRMVRECVYRNGLCPEMFTCGYNKTDAFEKELEEYIEGFEGQICDKTNIRKGTNK